MPRLLPVLVFVLTASLHAQSLCTRLGALTQDPSVAAAHWGISVTTLTGEPLCGIHDAQLFRPASNAKLFTATAALALLGPDTVTASTVVYRDKSAPKDLYLAGTGDAYLSERPMPYTRTPPVASPRNPLEQLADEVARTGLKHIEGDIIGDDSGWPYEPIGDDWSAGDLLWGYGAPISALSVNDNKLALTVAPGAAIGSSAIVTLAPAMAFYTIASNATTTAATTTPHLRVDRTPGTRILRITGTVALDAAYHDDIAIDDPALYAALIFKTLLEARGIVIDGTARAKHLEPARTDSMTTPMQQVLVLPAKNRLTQSLKPSMQDTREVLARHAAPSLLDDITVTLKVSQNLHAELLLHTLGKAFTDDGSVAQGARVVRQFALNAGLNKNDFYLNDGSGLSTHDLVAPRAFTQLLAFAARQPWFPGFKAALPVGGVDGSLASRFMGPLKGKVFAKTGTLGESRALSGYLTAASGQTILFSILVDNHLPGTTADRTLTDQMVELIAAAN